MNEKMPCPCTSGKIYRNCCRPFHQGQLPKTALQLMRSRYSAYALCLPEYIIQTTDPSGPQFKPDLTQWTKEIVEFCLGTQFKKLEILYFEEKEHSALVTFVAHLAQGNKDVSFTERSLFAKIKGKWFYTAPLK